MAGGNGNQPRIIFEFMVIAHVIIGAVLELIAYFVSPPEPIEPPFSPPVAFNPNNPIGWSPDVGPVIRSPAEESSSRIEDDLAGATQKLSFDED